MPTSTRRAPGWSKRTDELVRYVSQRCRPGFRSELAHWLEDSSRFRAFITTHQDKVRKKLSTPDEEEHRMDVRAELLVAYLLVADRRFELAFEAYGARRLGPDLTVSFRTNQRFNLEVTRLRTVADSSVAGAERLAASSVPGAERLANVIAGKLRQLPGDMPNALLIAARGRLVTEDTLVAAVRLLKTHTDARNDAFFARRGFKDARDFYTQYLHLGGIVVLDEATSPASTVFLPNREARQPLGKEALTALLQCLTGGQMRASVAASVTPSK